MTVSNSLRKHAYVTELTSAGH